MYPHIEAIQSFIDGMIEKATTHTELKAHFGLENDQATWLKDFKTVGYRAPRQCGATYWMHQDFLKYDDAILITPNQSVRETFRNSFTFNREYVPIGSAGDNTSLPLSVVRRVLTQMEISDFVRQDYDFFNITINRIYIQNSTAFFKAVRKEKFYNWLTNIGFDGVIICNDTG